MSVPLAGVETVDQDAVEAKIGDEQKLVVGRDVDRVGVRAGLAFVIHAGAGVLDERGGFAQRTVVVNGKHGYTSAVIVGGEEPVTGLIESDVAGAVAARGDSC